MVRKTTKKSSINSKKSSAKVVAKQVAPNAKFGMIKNRFRRAAQKTTVPNRTTHSSEIMPDVSNSSSPSRDSPKKAGDKPLAKVQNSSFQKRRKSGGPSNGATSAARRRSNRRSTNYERVVAIRSNKDKFILLDEVLRTSGFWSVLEETRSRLDIEKKNFGILVKPDLNAFELTGSTATDPQLVEHLIDRLHEHRYTRVALGESRNSFDRWLENRDVQILADLLGYRFVTIKGNAYEITDFAEDLVPGPFEPGCILRGSHLPRIWKEANFRIIFAKNKTDDENAYHLCLDNLISVLPLRDKDYHYKHRLNRSDVLIELLKHTTADFCIIDAYTSNHGNAGSRVARPLETRTLIAGHHLLLTDHVAAGKMGISPDASELHAKAVRYFGLPEPHRIDGDLTPYSNWINVHPVVLHSTREREAWPELSQVLQPWLQMIDQETFSFKDPVNERLNRALSPYLAGIDENLSVFWTVVGLNYVLGTLHRALKPLQVMYWKDSLRQEEVALNIRPEDYAPNDYEAIASYLEPLEEQVRALTPDPNGLRWTYHNDRSILFEFSRIIPVEYDDFVRRVDVAKTIQYMNDYIGGLIIQIQEDNQSRVTHQIERNLYLPQPNYLALYQGLNIDVSKLELVRYMDDEQKMFWKTVKSENGSAKFDDGMARFVRLKNSETLVSIFGRQQFTLPLFWEIINLDNYPALKHILVTHAYTTFFIQTMANLEAVYEGRDVRIGRAWNPRAGESDTVDDLGSWSHRIGAFLNAAQDFMQRNILDREGFISRLFSPYNPQPDYIDENGFAHFKRPTTSEASQKERAQTDGGELGVAFSAGKAALQDFWTDLYRAIRKDMGIQYG
jgi:uncharacterized protein (DUF362 family)